VKNPVAVEKVPELMLVRLQLLFIATLGGLLLMMDSRYKQARVPVYTQSPCLGTRILQLCPAVEKSILPVAGQRL